MGGREGFLNLTLGAAVKWFMENFLFFFTDDRALTTRCMVCHPRINNATAGGEPLNPLHFVSLPSLTSLCSHRPLLQCLLSAPQPWLGGCLDSVKGHNCSPLKGVRTPGRCWEGCQLIFVRFAPPQYKCLQVGEILKQNHFPWSSV